MKCSNLWSISPSLTDERLFLSLPRVVSAAGGRWMLYRPRRCSYAVFVFGKMKQFFISDQQLLRLLSGVRPHKLTHTNTQAGMPNDLTHQFCHALDAKHNSLTNRYTPTHKSTIIRHCVTVAVQGETEESFDRVSDNAQCLLLHSFSITRQYARSTLAAANSFSLADLHLRTELPISSLFSGFLE